MIFGLSKQGDLVGHAIEGKTFVIIFPSPSARQHRSDITRCQNN
jgi:hypothetical protein